MGVFRHAAVVLGIGMAAIALQVTLIDWVLPESLMPNLLVPDIVEAIRASKAFKVFICNVATQAGETDGFDAAAHLAAIDNHVGPGLVDLLVVNTCDVYPPIPNVEWVKLDEENPPGVPFYAVDLVDDDRPWRHDAAKLAETLISLLEERTGPLDLPPPEVIEAFQGYA